MIDLSVGVAGMGFVGNAVARGFEGHVSELKCYDIDPERSKCSLKDVLECDVVFACLPTPKGRKGKASLSAIYQFFSQASLEYYGAQFILKSTVPPGTTDDLVERYDIPVCHSPEFLTARTAVEDFASPSQIVIGGSIREFALQMFHDRFPGVPIRHMRAVDSEMAKYVINTFFATKIAFFNEAKLIAEELECDWSKVIDAVRGDGRINPSHTDVPGHDGITGFGGACLPKDLAAMISFGEEAASTVAATPDLLRAVAAKNHLLRHNAGRSA